MKYIITESQYNLLMENEYSPQLLRRYSMIKDWLEENLPNIDFSYYGSEDEELLMMYVINIFLQSITSYDYLFDVFHEIPQQDIIDFIMTNFKDMIINYVKED